MKFRAWLESKLRWSYILQYLIEVYYEFAICSVLNLMNYRLGFNPEGISSFFAAFTLFMTISIPLFWTQKLLNMRNTLKKRNTKREWGVLYEGLKINLNSTFLFQIVQLLRKLLWAMTYVFLKDYLVIQFMILSISSILMCAYMLSFRPFHSKKIMAQQLINELCIWLIQIVLISFSGINFSPQIKYDMGWMLIGLIVAVYSLNLLLLMFETVISLLYHFR